MLSPDKKSLLPAQGDMPDTSWVKLVPNEIQLEGHGSGFAEILLEVPNDPKYVGRHFQVHIWAHTSEPGMLGAGVISRFRFSTGAGPETLKAEKRRKAMLTLDFDMTPQIIQLDDVEPGVLHQRERKLRQIHQNHQPRGIAAAFDHGERGLGQALLGAAGLRSRAGPVLAAGGAGENDGGRAANQSREDAVANSQGRHHGERNTPSWSVRNCRWGRKSTCSRACW